ncbi:hypothetical protein IMG5_055340 [Ichthyophthirius multifiliis]|uniref:Transmembrane protein n=1 Tax=Ichthyophthirius multifiliis TaxID=5932 RepID=G0QN53_ICHMU|nr:hypothetical protein IMG5_055340 [Ichthyophthirius multifiliis]EGR33355.1 hypothetical protein IMG5_055340 [Ichthyophthirius multifiliis]|eukprot:XP_004037341.1 hypothetical protein IMG5_055340 [Ichthyophthirius multifiliis]
MIKKITSLITIFAIVGTIAYVFNSENFQDNHLLKKLQKNLKQPFNLNAFSYGQSSNCIKYCTDIGGVNCLNNGQAHCCKDKASCIQNPIVKTSFLCADTHIHSKFTTITSQSQCEKANTNENPKPNTNANANILKVGLILLALLALLF